MTAVPTNRPRRPKATEIKAQQLPFPASQADMHPPPQTALEGYRPAGKLEGRIALITGGDSGIGRAVALGFALEGAAVAIMFNERDDDAQETRRMIEGRGGRCLTIQADVRHAAECSRAVAETVSAFGGLNILVNNAAFQKAVLRFEDIPEEQLRRTFDVNIIGYMLMAQAALPHLVEGDAIVNTGSIVGLTGEPTLIDYCGSKGAIHAFTKALALHLGKRGIRVNAVCPGPVWTPAIPSTLPPEAVEHFGHEVALERPGQPDELVPAYVLLASEDGSFMTGALVEVTGGRLSAG